MTRPRDDDRVRALLAARRSRRDASAHGDAFTAEWFPEQRAFYEDPAQLIAGLCSRRAGKTRGGCRAMVKAARTTRDGRFLYVNATLAECRKLAWHGARGDGMASLVKNEKIHAELNETELTIHFPEVDSWIYLRGADDEKTVRAMLGLPYHEVWWDEAQKIPSKLTATIMEVLTPSLLDYGGRLRLTGTPTRTMAGMFYDITRPDVEKRPKWTRAWSRHHWTLLDNTFFGATREDRFQRGLIGLQTLLGGADVAPLDSPLMQREGGGKWIYEDADYVYPVRAVPDDVLFYADARWIDNASGPPMVDLEAALRDLPGEGDEAWRDYFFALGTDLGFDPDPFAIVLWAWRPGDPCLYEVVSWKKTQVLPRDAAALLHSIRERVHLAILVADAGGGGKLTVAGWSDEWIDRWGVPITEAEKHNKATAIEMVGDDIRAGLIKLRGGGALYEEWSELQWATVVTATGRKIEDPTMANHCSDAGLYAHRHSFHHRFRAPPPPPPAPDTPEWALRQEQELEDALDDGS